jgi:hypothetical protein
VIGLVERHHHRAALAAQARARDGSPQLTSTIGRGEFEADLDGCVRADEITFPQVAFAGVMQL